VFSWFLDTEFVLLHAGRIWCLLFHENSDVSASFVILEAVGASRFLRYFVLLILGGLVAWRDSQTS
jgi:hypothetical protein